MLITIYLSYFFLFFAKIVTTVLSNSISVLCTCICACECVCICAYQGGELEGKRVCVYSYGSGSMASLYRCTHTYTHTHTLACTHVHRQKILRNLIRKHTCIFMYLYTYMYMYSIIIPQTHVHFYSINTLIHMCICPQTHTLIDTYMGATTLHFSHCETPPYLVRAHYNPFYTTSLLLSF